MRDGWEDEAEKWAAFAGVPGRDHAHENINLPALRMPEPEPGPGRRTLDLACGEGRVSRYLCRAGYQVTGADAAPTMVRRAGGHPHAARPWSPPRPDWVTGRDGVTMTFHSEHRPLEAYSRALEAAGLLIEAISRPGCRTRRSRPNQPGGAGSGSRRPCTCAR